MFEKARFIQHYEGTDENPYDGLPDGTVVWCSPKDIGLSGSRVWWNYHFNTAWYYAAVFPNDIRADQYNAHNLKQNAYIVRWVTLKELDACIAHIHAIRGLTVPENMEHDVKTYTYMWMGTEWVERHPVTFSGMYMYHQEF